MRYKPFIIITLVLLFLMIQTVSAQTGFFWEEPEVFSAGQGNFPVTAYNGDFGILVWQESVQRVPAGEAGDGSINVALAVKRPGEPWVKRGIIGGPYIYSGAEPSILSAVVDRDNRILIAAAASTSEAEILVSDDFGENFNRYRVHSGSESSLTPRISVCSDGNYLLFVTRGSENSISTFYARSVNGRDWSAFAPLVTERGMELNFLPSHVSFQGREYVIFQSFIRSAETVPTFQLFLKISNDGGRTWGPSRRFTDFQDHGINTGVSADRFDNQRPFLSVQGDSLFLVWERRLSTSSPQIYAVRINADGMPAGMAERVSSGGAFCNNPIAFSYRGETRILWFDNRRGVNHVYMAWNTGIRWDNEELPGSGLGEGSFGRAVVDSDGLFLFWQAVSRGSSRIYFLSPDISVDAPRLAAQNFTPGRRTRGDRVQVSWNVPNDSSGIQGFSWVWSQDENLVPARDILLYNTTGRPQSMTLEATEDGLWYLSVISRDHAGNWSSPARITYFRDTTPPPPPLLIQPNMDANGYLASNTFSINWEASPVPDLAGYTWSFDYIAASFPFAGMDNERFTAAAGERYSAVAAGAPRNMGRATSVTHTNIDDGVWRFTLRAIDAAGNVGQPLVAFFRTNKYVPRTYITLAEAAQDQQGILNIRLIGRGFSHGGEISRIFLDSDGRPPYDREFLLSRGDYTVVSDREIRELMAGDMDAGNYRIGLEHPTRGLYFTEPIATVSELGTVKFGDYSSAWRPSWQYKTEQRFSPNAGHIVLISILVLCGLGLLVSVRGIGEAIAEGAAIRLDAAALLSGDLMTAEKKKRLVRIRKQGMGLRLKLASFTTALVMIVVIMVSAPLYVIMTQTRQESLIDGLWDRSKVLLEGLATSARAYLPLRSALELGLLPAQMNSVPEARYITITGYNPETTVFYDQVWATNDPDILDKIDTAEFQPGVSRITDVLTPRLQGIADELNERARYEVGNLSQSIISLTQEAQSILLRTDRASQLRLEDIQVQVRNLQARVSERLSEISGAILSEPEYSRTNFVAPDDYKFIFYKPVMFRQGSEDVFFRGLVRLEVSVESILDEIAEGQKTLITVILLVALAALVIGTIGALLLAAIIIRPIRQLVRHVEIIRDTEDKAKLEGIDIILKSRDELAILGNTINDMTHGLVKAAAAASDLSVGKEIQKKFIPLELDRDGNKLSYGSKDTKYLNFFGYYEGAKGVSGDYFDYLDLDGRYYAIIKCDVAGKGIPAALIMIQVATMFISYFRRWKPSEASMHIEDLTYQINDFIETLGFKGRFAAFTLCLFDAETGIARFCNAGDNVIHLFDASERKIKILTLPETPATGVLPNFMVQSKGGYSVQTMTLDHGDILLLYTDGIEEAKRRFRNSNFEEIICEEGEVDTPHETHTVGQGDEEMGPDRVEAIINAVMNKQVYTLHKWHNPEGDDKNLTFDFSSAKGSVEEVIMAMVSVEKMFRCYQSPNYTEENRVLVDAIVDKYLKAHFLQYRNYCSRTKENPGNNAYMYYTHLMEDDQYDDLTILGIKRK